MTLEKQLTKAETQVMSVLWSMPNNSGFSSEIINSYPKPKPALTTLLTFLKILRGKGYVKAEKQGKAQLFIATVKKDEYIHAYMKEVADLFFNGSAISLISFVASHEQLSDKEVNDLIIQLLNRKK